MKKRMTGMFVGALSLALAGVAAFSSTPAVAGDKDMKAAKVGEKAPDFTLTDLDGDTHSLSDHKGKVVVLEWFNPQCPYIVKHHERFTTMYDLASEFKDDGVVWMAINSNKPGSQGSAKSLNEQAKSEWNIQYPILMDPESKVGRMYGAKTTPHMYIIDEQGTLIYSGAIDDNSSARTLGDTNYVRQALTEHLAGKDVSMPETSPYGCSVKY